MLLFTSNREFWATHTLYVDYSANLLIGIM